MRVKNEPRSKLGILTAGFGVLYDQRSPNIVFCACLVRIVRQLFQGNIRGGSVLCTYEAKQDRVLFSDRNFYLDGPWCRTSCKNQIEN